MLITLDDCNNQKLITYPNRDTVQIKNMKIIKYLAVLIIRLNNTLTTNFFIKLL